ncbi:rod shape-determining protein MreC [Priestia aryabhattai]|uniref:rod shape-determining protein MreC n=1 Tax=Priestia aryabhattai TaxID=412384 RepID=UPI001C8DD6E7|nr:rod shape-determining protein MreC [Priestia aryabhattai]MBX9983701.1 rod shape-determining protein MreC [Priestia aryabhattai]MBY0003656.1 rod shape-determining protein MreC [Priestia aryabhattai]
MIRFQKKKKRYSYVLTGGIIAIGSFIFIGALYKGSLPFLDKVSWNEPQQVSRLFTTYKENVTLKNKIATDNQAEANVYKLEHENNVLTKLLKVQNQMKAYNPISATVIDRSTSNWDNELSIDKGTKQGIKVDMNVLNANGVIGKVSKVFSSTSTVELVSSNFRTNRMAVILKDKKDVNGTLENYDEKKGDLIIRKTPSAAKVNVGDKVQTSPISSIFQGELDLGKVIKVKPDEYGLTQLALVKPSSTFNDISEVIVIKAKNNE